MKTMKKVLALVLAAVMLMTCGITLAGASNETQTDCSFGSITELPDKISEFFMGMFDKIKAFFTKIADLFIGNNFTGEDYTIPELDLSVMP